MRVSNGLYKFRQKTGLNFDISYKFISIFSVHSVFNIYIKVFEYKIVAKRLNILITNFVMKMYALTDR